MMGGEQQRGRTGSRPAIHCAALALFCSAGCWHSADPKELTAVSWGGYYAEASVEAYYEPLEASTGFTVRRIQYGGGLEVIEEQVTSGDLV